MYKIKFINGDEIKVNDYEFIIVSDSLGVVPISNDKKGIAQINPKEVLYIYQIK